MKIKNVIFDIGGVLLDWKPIELLKEMTDEKKAVVLKSNMMDSKYWAELDKGTITLDQAVNLFSQNIPELRDDIEFVLNHFIDYLPVIKENVEILYKLSRDNYRLYILSNFHLESFLKAYEKYPFFNLFEGLVISSRVKLIKPEREIYEYLLDKYSLNPNETVFFDDSEKNVWAAADLGINAVHTPTVERLQDFYKKSLKKGR